MDEAAIRMWAYEQVSWGNPHDAATIGVADRLAAWVMSGTVPADAPAAADPAPPIPPQGALTTADPAA